MGFEYVDFGIAMSAGIQTAAFCFYTHSDLPQ